MPITSVKRTSSAVNGEGTAEGTQAVVFCRLSQWLVQPVTQGGAQRWAARGVVEEVNTCEPPSTQRLQEDYETLFWNLMNCGIFNIQ